MKRKGKDGKRKRETSMPTDEPSFVDFVRGLSRQIARLKFHLSQLSHVHDYRARRRLESMIDQRGKALCQPPASVTVETITNLRKEIETA